jgi:hypothetical protein
MLLKKRMRNLCHEIADVREYQSRVMDGTSFLPLPFNITYPLSFSVSFLMAMHRPIP